MSNGLLDYSSPPLLNFAQAMTINPSMQLEGV
jgi:hypothetical protein